MENSDVQLIQFITKTTEAITVISESMRTQAQTTGAIKEILTSQNEASIKSFEKIDGKMEGLMTMFKYVILPLIGGILALVGIKMIFRL